MKETKRVNTSVSATASGSFRPSSAPEGSIDSEDSPQAFLSVHNSARSEVGVVPLTWDDIVAAYARNKANKSISDCSLVISTGPYGENLASSTGNLAGNDAVRLWLAEKADYDLETNICASGRSCDHYTQRPTNGSQPPPRAVPPFASPLSPLKGKKDIKGLIVGLIAGACALIFVLGFIWFISRRKRLKGKQLDDHAVDMFFGGKLQDGRAPKKFSLVEIAKVTSNFKCEKLGEGGFGAVYKGYLRDSDTYVAVKRISKASKQGIKEYASEVNIISRLRHRNLIKLIGWCHEKGELILVYEFMDNGSLDSHLFKDKSLLTWELRYKIV
ncbi:hypothetical protein DITRI_Ditri08aG0094600 [Diplodiscus trichospermus]